MKPLSAEIFDCSSIKKTKKNIAFVGVSSVFQADEIMRGKGRTVVAKWDIILVTPFIQQSSGVSYCMRPGIILKQQHPLRHKTRL